MNEKQQQLTFNKGITNIPSDALCDDNELEVSENIVYRDGEHQPIQDPVKLCDDNGAIQILRVHKVGNVDNYIALYDDGVLGYFQKTNSGTTVYKQTLLRDISQEGLMSEIIGKTIVIRTSDDLHYFIWSGTMYKDLGTSVPKPESVEFQTYSGYDYVRPDEMYYFPDSRWEGSWSWLAENKEAKENIARGCFGESRSKLFDRKLFNGPFFVRYAVEMYDGSYVHVSNPILMYPNFGDEVQFYRYTSFNFASFRFCTHGCSLRYKATYDFSEEWEDLVKGVTVFASVPVKTSNYDKCFDIQYDSVNYGMKWVSEGKIYNASTTPLAGYLSAFLPRDEKDVIKDLKESGNFYKIAELGKKSNVVDWTAMDDLMNTARITDPDILVTQLQLPDSYMEENYKYPEHLFSYNGRLVLANVQRSLSTISSQFIGYNKQEPHDYEVYVTIQTDDGEKTAHISLKNSVQQFQYYFYYPDTRARKVRVYEVLDATTGSAKKIVDMALEESSVLNGAFFLAPNLPPFNSEIDVEEFLPDGYDDSDELLSNQLYISDVNNPWKYSASGNLTVGFGDIIGLSTQTTAISQGQFGQYPLLIFTTEGIYAASLNNEGVFTAVHPMSREVCNNPDSITQTDGAVFFSSDKGLMVIVGNDVRCVSEQLSGEFPNILKTAKIAYDYRDSLLWIASDTDRDRVFGDKCWVYNIKSGTFHKSSYFEAVEGGEIVERLSFNGFFSDSNPRRRVAPAYPEPIPVPHVIQGVYDKVALQAEVLDALMTSIESGTISAVRNYNPYSTTDIFYDYRTGKFYNYISIYFAYPDETGETGYFIRRMYTKFTDSEHYYDNGSPRTNVVYYNNNFRYRWNGEDAFETIYDFSGVLEESPAEPSPTLEDGMLLDIEETVNVFAKLVPYSYYFNYENKDIVFDPGRKRFILRWVRNYTNPDDGTASDYTLYFTKSSLLTRYVDESNDYHPFSNYVYQDRTSESDFSLYKWDNTDFENIPGTDTTETYYLSGWMYNIELDDSLLITYLDGQGNVVEENSLRVGPVIDLQEYESGYSDYEKFDADKLREHLYNVLISNLAPPDLDAVASGVMFYNDEKKFVEQRSYYYNFGGVRYSGQMYYDTFVWGVETAAQHLPSANVLYIMNSTSYYSWNSDSQSLQPSFVGLANIVNSYPDTLFHMLGDGIYSLMERPQPTDDENTYNGVIMTRPMKLENALALKSIMQIRHIKSMDGTITMRIFASNNMKEWVELHSLRGIPWLYYKFSFVFSNMPATDRFAGTMLITQERRLNKMR